MRFLGLLSIGASTYVGSAFVSLERLAAAARAADGAQLIARTNIPRVRHAIINQLITAYLEKIGQRSQVKPFEKRAIETFGASIADELAIKLVTADNLSALLKPVPFKIARRNWNLLVCRHWQISAFSMLWTCHEGFG
jgi:hypothetical protein